MSIAISAYSTLNSYAVLAASGITTVNTTTITNGVYGTPAGIGITGTYVGTLDGANATAAQTQLTALVGAINTYRSGLTSSTIGTILFPITLYPNINYNSGSTISFQNMPIILDAQGNSNAQFFITAGTSITFNNVSSITLINGALNCNVFWLAGTAIGFMGTSQSSIPGIFIAGSAITFANASSISGRLYARTANVTFSGTSSVNASCSSAPQEIVCYLKGTLILTKDGYVPIENIKTGDKVITKGKIFRNKVLNKAAKLKIEPVYWASKFKVIDVNSKSRPICIQKGALDKNYPFQDLYVSPNHSLLLNGRMVLAKQLINGETIYQDTEIDNIEYYHLECETHSAIIANGVLSESYYGGNNRYVFENSISLRRRIDLKKIYSFK